jgi:hypothetical protein
VCGYFGFVRSHVKQNHTRPRPHQRGSSLGHSAARQSPTSTYTRNLYSRCAHRGRNNPTPQPSRAPRSSICRRCRRLCRLEPAPSSCCSVIRENSRASMARQWLPPHARSPAQTRATVAHGGSPSDPDFLACARFVQHTVHVTTSLPPVSHFNGWKLGLKNMILAMNLAKRMRLAP